MEVGEKRRQGFIHTIASFRFVKQPHRDPENAPRCARIDRHPLPPLQLRAARKDGSQCRLRSIFCTARIQRYR
jgi:hypothetical protein